MTDAQHTDRADSAGLSATQAALKEAARRLEPFVGMAGSPYSDNGVYAAARFARNTLLAAARTAALKTPAGGAELQAGRDDRREVFRAWTLSHAPDGWRLFRDGTRVEGPWSDRDVALAEDARADAIMAELATLAASAGAAVGAGGLRKAMQEACDLLAERTQGSPARSAGHNARLHLEAALAKPAAPDTEATESLFEEIGHAIASAEAEFHYSKLDREADGAHRALTEVSKIRRAALTAGGASE